MKAADLIRLLGAGIPHELAKDLVGEYLQLRQDVASGTLGRTSAGKFVETLVQALQYLENGSFDRSPEVDKYLKGLESRTSNLPDGLRICASRVARAAYCLRSKRSIAHKGEIDPNAIDLGFLHAATQWLLAELIRTVAQTGISEAGDMIRRVQAPVGSLVEDLGDRRLTVAGLTARDELLLLLSASYPEPQTLDELCRSADRIARKTVSNTIRTLWAKRLVEGTPSNGYKLTASGLNEARGIAVRAAGAQL